ncbi:MAG: hypothetical protein AAFY88_24570, partial [Acidobacteriota bacterium]
MPALSPDAPPIAAQPVNESSDSETTASALEGALAEWRRLVGGQHVLHDAATSASYSAATYAVHETDGDRPRVPAVLRPGTREELRRAVEIAHRHRVPLYPVSGGR